MRELQLLDRPAHILEMDIINRVREKDDQRPLAMAKAKLLRLRTEG